MEIVGQKQRPKSVTVTVTEIKAALKKFNFSQSVFVKLADQLSKADLQEVDHCVADMLVELVPDGVPVPPAMAAFAVLVADSTDYRGPRMSIELTRVFNQAFHNTVKKAIAKQKSLLNPDQIGYMIEMPGPSDNFSLRDLLSERQSAWESDFNFRSQIARLEEQMARLVMNNEKLERHRQDLIRTQNDMRDIAAANYDKMRMIEERSQALEKECVELTGRLKEAESSKPVYVEEPTFVLSEEINKDTGLSEIINTMRKSYKAKYNKTSGLRRYIVDRLSMCMFDTLYDVLETTPDTVKEYANIRRIVKHATYGTGGEL
jgi:hypothetical protein